MNKKHLDQIIANYIDKFAYLNEPEPGHNESYKWRIAKQFRPMMDAALAGSDENLPKALYDLRIFTQNMIDSTTLPLTALSEFAKYEPATVRQMFLNLFSEDDNNLSIRMTKIVDFLESEAELRKKYTPTSWKYKNSVHSVTCYQTLYDPDNNYILKPSQSEAFAKCIEFYDSWGTGTNTKLDVFYRMCDQTAEYLESNDSLMKTHNSRYGLFPSESLHPDLAHHILVYDIIYCCSEKTHNLYHGVTFSPVPSAKERILREELSQNAIKAQLQLEIARKEAEQYEDIIEKIHSIFSVGTRITAKNYGEGMILATDGKDKITVEFPQIKKTVSMGLGYSVTNNIISCTDKPLPDYVRENKSVISRGSTASVNYIFNNLIAAEHEFEKYEAYLDF